MMTDINPVWACLALIGLFVLWVVTIRAGREAHRLNRKFKKSQRDEPPL